MDFADHKTPPVKCPSCKGSTGDSPLNLADYLCPRCSFELAHLDMAPNGSVRGVFGYLLSPGYTLKGRYRIQNVMGKGGFGATYLAEDLKLNEKLRALKEIPELLFDEQEVKILSRISHPAIPDITDRFKDGGMVYLVMEFGGSRTLGSECRRLGGRIPLPRVILYMRQLCEVLTYIHSQDPAVIHRDLKPDNILIDDNDRIMLIDFGIAKQGYPEIATRLMARASSHGFSSPEQVLGTGTDERSDIYSFGATLYFLLTGHVPPPAHERLAGKEVEPPSSLVPDSFAPELDRIILNTLCLNVNHRPGKIEDLRCMVEGLTKLVGSGSMNAPQTVMLDREAFPPPDRKSPVEGIKIITTRKMQKESLREAAHGNLRRIAASLIALAIIISLGAYFAFKATPPGAPKEVRATADNAHVLVSFNAPGSDGGSPVTSYIVTSNPGGVSAEGEASPITVNGLAGGSSYTFTVTAINTIGPGPESSPSGSITIPEIIGADRQPKQVIPSDKRRPPKLSAKYLIYKMLNGNTGNR